jgi:predicted nucleotidyltransferase
MNTKQEILNFLQANQTYIKNKFFIRKMGVFGSFARDEQTSESDVDILITIDKNAKNIYDLKTSLNEYLSTAFGRKVDLAREKYLKPYAKQEILKDTIYAYQS